MNLLLLLFLFYDIKKTAIFTFLASFSAFKRNFSSFFRFSAEYSFLLFSLTIFSLILLLHSFEVDDSSLVFDVFLLLFSEMMKNGLRDVDGGGVISFGFSVGEANARVFAGFGLIGATFAVMPNFETADCELLDVVVLLLLNRGTVSSDAGFVFCDVYEANLIF